MCDYTSEEIEEVYRKRREYAANKKASPISKILRWDETKRALIAMNEAVMSIQELIRRANQPPHNWGTNERA